ncbi:HpcH/HpaI aldolase/citrate lyase family protein [Streptomyces sp. WI04-05B]|uniref:HpcH/HpaI aldolase/citrate lyase family protein n=1 Tax=Streptomyces TaxID=1883 RepID=UPI0029B15833|nr:MULTISPECIES: CoA ester lyase [unclassified Streptomyces]MDX2547996.1 CoA ester lyase [Streptomyces sp. WI04-05B]MDX2583335.1 CoA ester lyase [Streptomyces sp. WI04-05A]MDX3745103.1 CoA ester lyase [Streptomyces sp. AK08-02]
MIPVLSARSLLFVPGHRPDRFDKAASSGADVVIIDLEDAVAAEDKDRARANAAAWLALGNRAIVRINAPGTPWSEADLRVTADHGCPVMVPKAEDPAVLASLAARTAGRCGLVPLVETALGVERAREVCAAPGVTRAAFGNVDLAAQLGIAQDDHTALAHARSRLVVASAAAGISPPVDGVTTAVRDMDTLSADIAHARRLGFTGKLCIHPHQLPRVAAGFAPSAEEVRWARAVLDAGHSVTTVDGQMVDKPVLERARRVLAQAHGPHPAT